MRALLPNRRMPRRTATAVEKTLPAPIGGWNARDSYAGMKPTDAVDLENWFPRPSFVEMRGGSVLHMNQIPGTVKTLAVYTGLDGTNAMLAFTDEGIYEATFGGESAGTNLSSGRTSGKCVWEMFGDGTNNWLISVNGVDEPWYFNGTTYVEVTGATSPAITGLTTTDIVSVAVFKERLFFIRNDKLGFDYLPAGDAGGAATYFDLASIASDGGYLMAICSWSRDAGDGPDDFWVGITSEGEAIVYQGIDPSTAADWVLVGVYKIGKPLGRRCVLKKFGADPIVLTQDGAFPMSAVLQSGDERHKFALSYKIEDAFAAATRSAFDTYGWRILSFPEQKALIVNVPKREDGPHEQYVMNTISKAWCKFTGWHAEDFCVFERELYFCRGSAIFKAWTADMMDGILNPGALQTGYKINYYAKQAYQGFGSDSIKRPLMYMPILIANRRLSYATGIDTDFVTRSMGQATTATESNAGRWGVSQWGAAKWSSGDNIVNNWGGTATWPGRWLSGKLRIVSDDVTAQWMGSVMRFEVGSGL